MHTHTRARTPHLRRLGIVQVSEASPTRVAAPGLILAPRKLPVLLVLIVALKLRLCTNNPPL
jgi:hypothetical protein